VIYLPLLVLGIVTLIAAGWRRGGAIVGGSLLVCWLFGAWRFVDLRAVPGNLWRGARGVLLLPLYLARNPGDWLPILLPIGGVSILIAAGVGGSLLVCWLFGAWRFVDLRAVPGNLWRGARGVLLLPLYLARNPGDWLPILLPIGGVSILIAAGVGLRHWRLRRTSRS
jgi:hypothetical protein